MTAPDTEGRREAWKPCAACDYFWQCDGSCGDHFVGSLERRRPVPPSTATEPEEDTVSEDDSAQNSATKEDATFLCADADGRVMPNTWGYGADGSPFWIGPAPEPVAGGSEVREEWGVQPAADDFGDDQVNEFGSDREAAQFLIDTTVGPWKLMHRTATVGPWVEVPRG